MAGDTTRLVRFADLARGACSLRSPRGGWVASFLTPHFSQGTARRATTTDPLIPHPSLLIMGNHKGCPLRPHSYDLPPPTSLLPPPSSHLPPHSSLLIPHSSLLRPHSSLLTPTTSLLIPPTSPLSAGNTAVADRAVFGGLPVLRFAGGCRLPSRSTAGRMRGCWLLAG